MIMFVCFADFGFRIIQKSMGVSTVTKQSMMPTNQIHTHCTKITSNHQTNEPLITKKYTICCQQVVYCGWKLMLFVILLTNEYQQAIKQTTRPPMLLLSLFSSPFTFFSSPYISSFFNNVTFHLIRVC